MTIRLLTTTKLNHCSLFFNQKGRFGDFPKMSFLCKKNCLRSNWCDRPFKNFDGTFFFLQRSSICIWMKNVLEKSQTNFHSILRLYPSFSFHLKKQFNHQWIKAVNLFCFRFVLQQVTNGSSVVKYSINILVSVMSLIFFLIEVRLV